MDDNYIGNISTIVKTLLMMFAGWMLGWCVSIGLNLPISQEQLSEILFTMICFIAAYIDAKNPNSFKFLGNSKAVDLGTVLGYPQEETVLNDEYIIGDDTDGI